MKLQEMQLDNNQTLYMKSWYINLKILWFYFWMIGLEQLYIFIIIQHYNNKNIHRDSSISNNFIICIPTIFCMIELKFVIYDMLYALSWWKYICTHE